jgi:undecaprenyl-diphosphatase
MTIFQAIIYGIIQGLSEFLPVSSSGHLALLPHIMHIPDPGVVFDLMMHFGTGMAVIIYFRHDILRYARTLSPSLVDLRVGGEDRWFTRNFIWSTFVSVCCIVILLPISKLARDPMIIVANLSVFGLLLWIADIVNRKRESHLIAPMETGMQWKLAALIGMSQALAIFPGVSRSGITLTMALILGMRRKEAAAFSFLLSLPIIMAGILKEISDLVKEGNTDQFLVLMAGVLTSFIAGWLTVHFFMKLIARIHLVYFAIYRWIIAGLMVWSLSAA